MELMRRIAFETVLRACSFGSLAIFCVMIGLSFEPHAAFQAGAMLTLLMAAILMLKAYGARTKNYRKTELWLYLDDEQRPPEAQAQRMTFGSARADLPHICAMDGDGRGCSGIAVARHVPDATMALRQVVLHRTPR